MSASEVPIWRAWRRSSGDVLCVRSVRGGQVQIGSSGAGQLTVPLTPMHGSACDVELRVPLAGQGRRGGTTGIGRHDQAPVQNEITNG